MIPPEKLKEWRELAGRKTSYHYLEGAYPIEFARWAQNELNRYREAFPALLDEVERLRDGWNKDCEIQGEQQIEIIRLREALERMVRLYESEHDEANSFRPAWLRTALGEGK